MSIHSLRPLAYFASPPYGGGPIDGVLQNYVPVGDSDIGVCLQVLNDGKTANVDYNGGVGTGAFAVYFFDDGIIPVGAIINSVELIIHHSASSNFLSGPGTSSVSSISAPAGAFSVIPLDPNSLIVSSGILTINPGTGIAWLRSDLFSDNDFNSQADGSWTVFFQTDGSTFLDKVDQIELKIDYVGTEVTSCFPSQGGIFGGASVAVNGNGFSGAGVLTNVYFDGIPASSIFLVNDNVITCDNPAHPLGSVFVSVEFDGSDITVSNTPIFTYQQFSWTLLEPDKKYFAGDIVTFEAPDIPGQELTKIDQVQLTFGEHTLLIDKEKVILDGVEIWWMFYFIIFTPIQFKFILPLQLKRFAGPLTITFLGEQFSGSVIGGTLQILFEDASGIYSLAKDQTSDILYFRQGYTTVIKLIGISNILTQDDTTSEDIITDNFFSLLPYPEKILAQGNLEDDSNLDDSILEDFTIISTLQVVVVFKNAIIPSPFIKTAFLP